MTIIKKCLYCGKSYNAERDSRKYCSYTCSDNALKKRVVLNCKFCGKQFETHPYVIKNDKGKFCSKDCYTKSMHKRVIQVCKMCGKEFETFPSQIKHGKGKFCSTKCQYKSQSGELHYLWKEGKSYEPYCTLFNKDFKERVREFWGRKCGICGKLEKDCKNKLAVHHVNYDKETCCNSTIPLFIPLCQSHHCKTNWNRDYWEEMLSNYIMIYFNGESYYSRSDI